MNANVDRFGKGYRDALQSYLRDLGEEHLHRAYEMGRDALVGGLGILEVVAAHQQALRSMLTIEEDAERSRALRGCQPLSGRMPVARSK